VHLSTSTFGTASFWQLGLTGLALVSIGSLALAASYVVLWTIGQLSGLPLAEVHLQVIGPAVGPAYVGWEIFANLVAFFLFLVAVRLTPLASYHGAEHKVVSAIERYGYVTEELAREMPRVHPRCGTTLLAGILPAFLIAVPLLMLAPVTGVMVIILGWMFRYRVGAVIQHYLTTREPNQQQLAAGVKAGRQLLENWHRRPFANVSLLSSLWQRGFVQLLIGVVGGSQLLQWVYSHLHIWLDWELWLG